MEVWKDLVDYEGEFEVSTHGRVRGLGRFVNVKNGKRFVKPIIRKNQNTTKGYKDVRLKRNEFSKLIHRLVAKTFIPNPENKEFINHKDGNKHNNFISNLEWATRQENEDHAFKTGLKSSTGSNNNMAKLNEDKVLAIREKHKQGYSVSIIAEMYDVHRWTIARIIKRLMWKHI